MTTSGTAVGMGGMIIIIWLMLGLAIYMIPSIIALAKRNKRTKVILFNIFLGWTVVMWIISLVWACKREEKPAEQPPYQPYPPQQPQYQAPQYQAPQQPIYQAPQQPQYQDPQQYNN